MVENELHLASVDDALVVFDAVAVRSPICPAVSRTIR